MPMIRNWYTERTQVSPNRQYQFRGYKDPCAEMELNYYECMESYGLRRGHILCEDYRYDYNECVTQNYSRQRTRIMFQERLRQVIKGEREPLKMFGPKVDRDAYQKGPFIP